MRAFSPAQPPASRSALIGGGQFDPGAVSNLQARYLDDGEPYHTGPTSGKYFVRDSSGNNLHAPVKTPCLRNIASVTNRVSIGVITLDGDFEISFWTKYEGDNAASLGPMFVGGGSQASGADYRSYIYYRPSTGLWQIVTDGESVKLTTSANAVLEDNKWHFVQAKRTGTTYEILVDSVSIGTATATVNRMTLRTILGSYTTYSVHGMMADLAINNAGTITYFPLQDGIGDGTNRNICWYKSDGTSGVISNAIVGGTVSNWWAAKCPGYAKDWCIEYGGKLGSNGAFILGNKTDGNCADGGAKTLSAGKRGNPGSSINLNPSWTNHDRAIPSELQWNQQLNDYLYPFNSGFSRVSADGSDRILIYSDEKTGSTLSALRSYVGISAPSTWTLDDLPGEIAAEYFAAIASNSGTISSSNQTAVINLLNGLQSAGLYDDVLCLYLFHGNHLNAARLNTINPTTVDGSGVITWVGTPTLNASGGITPSSGNYGKAVNPHYIGLHQVTSFGGAGIGFYSTSNSASSEKTIGNTTYFYLAPKYSGTSEVAASNSAIVGTVQDLSGFHFGTREPGTDNIAAYRNGSSYLTGTSAFSQGYSALNDNGILHIGGCNNNGSGNLASTTPIRLALVTRGLLSAQVVALNSLVQTYISELV